MIDIVVDAIKKHLPNTTGVRRQSAILMPLIKIDGIWHLLYEKRALTLSTQPGEICFPGGGLESGERPIDAAIRETCEELNVALDDIEIIGQIDSIMTSFDMLIHCYVGILHLTLEEIHYSKGEVDALIPVSIDALVTHPAKKYLIRSKFDIAEDFPFENIPNGKDYNFKTMSYPVVFYEFEHLTIWGLTARMTEQFVELIK